MVSDPNTIFKGISFSNPSARFWAKGQHYAPSSDALIQTLIGSIFLMLFTRLADLPHCAEHCGSDPSTLVLRPERTDAENGIVIHYGLIASGNTLCRDANLRGKFAQKGVLCFEMEAAGLINYFHCVVIRGVCYYSDSHKNKDWQRYAAMTAAAYTKDLLKHVAPSQVTTKRETRACRTKWLTGHYSGLLMATVFVFMLFLLVEASNVV
ncbi:hypothetical protein BFJ63_vAg8622 [Fusarium oxysporum f. sp. narcissi]|uniref:Nucleoside phosphorylase domain-containing protein n=1 Tax=Fusarium oxysporum f. sp. narcissi TaxID=451672 RepID=A0A4Q2VPQ9_FUSOX|nr:hypothetical protein BFJ63_vAg8622 [Fusarium oxysporum f. sp. narcissi]